MKLLKTYFMTIVILLVLIKINSKLTFDQWMFSSINMTPSTPEIKTGFQKLKSTS